VTPPEFDRLVEDAIRQIPVKYRRRLQNTVFVVEHDSPGGDLLGLHESNAPLPDKITIYQRPHERDARGPDELRRLVLETVLHEVGHALGMNEAGVRQMERERRRRWDRQMLPPSLFKRQ
jgi:predicted Zn-dependent protease with MMP-like domain